MRRRRVTKTEIVMRRGRWEEENGRTLSFWSWGNGV